MPIQNREDAVEVEERISRIFTATPGQRAAEVRGLLVEVLDFDAASGQVSLAGASGNVHLPDAAERIAELDGVYVLHIALPQSTMDRVRKAEVDAAAKVLAGQLGDDLLLVFTNASANQLHIILPSFAGARPTLRRMVVDRDLPRRTAVQQVSNIYWNHQASGSIRTAVDQAFDVEPVTREFFAEYKRIFEAAEASVSGFQNTAEGREEKRFFVQTLFNRLMFVYFLQRKGWLTFQGNKDYLDALWQDHRAQPNHGDFYTTRLQPLFFAGLNNPQSRDLNQDNAVLNSLIGKPPFLNGGLFEQAELDRRQGIIVPDSAIEQVLKGLFDRFNFTVMESTPFDIEVAVDPEMLGKVFEELVTGRHDSGAYYTPRSVVSFMCREALKGYLEGQNTGLDADAIARFVDAQETEDIQVARARRLADALAQVTVVDPACGSGAYLLGMMQELIELQTTLYNAGVDSKSLYDLKLEIIQRNLYGVDIDDFAVNIAMLRLWLSLAIDYEGEQPEPLPNLEFKVVCGDSLLGPDPSAGVEVQGTLGQDVEQFRRLGQLKADYMLSSPGPGKELLRRRIEESNTEIRQALGASAIDGVVDWRVDFGEVFAVKGGFDIAIANPPYVRFQKISREYKDQLKPTYGIATTGQSDLYCYFYVRALQMLGDGGTHVFVCSNSWLDVGYGAKLQEYLLNNAHIHSIYESAVERQFSTADINTIVSIISKTDPNESNETRFVSLRAEFDAALAYPEYRREISRKRLNLLAGGSVGGKFTGDKWGGKFLRAPDIYHHIMDKCADKFVRLGDIATVKRGVITGANQFFFLREEDVQRWGIEEEFLQPVMTTPQESNRISVAVARLPYRAFVCHETKSHLRGTNALKYIEWGEDQGFHRKSAPAARRLWYDLGQRDKSKTAINIFVNSTARTVLASQPLLFSDNFQVIQTHGLDPTTLCLSMNSTVCQLAINVEGRTNFGQGVLEIQTYEVANLRVVNPSLLPVPEAAIFDSTEWDVLSPSAEHWQIDGMVFDALGLTGRERRGVYEGVMELVGNRKQKAGSAPGVLQRASNPRGPYADAVGRNIAVRGKAIYEERIRPEIDAEADHGKIVAIDVFSEDYEIDPHISAGARRLAERRPGIVGYKMRIGYPRVYNMKPAS